MNGGKLGQDKSRCLPEENQTVKACAILTVWGRPVRRVLDDTDSNPPLPPGIFHSPPNGLKGYSHGIHELREHGVNARL